RHPERSEGSGGRAAPAQILRCAQDDPAGGSGSTAAAMKRSSLLPDDLAYLAPTSGSTGAPKWVAGRYRGIGHFVRWEAELLGLGRGTRVSQLTSPYFDAWLRDVFVPLTVAGTLVLPESAPEISDLRLDAEALAGWIDRAEIELVHSVPSLFHLLASG